MLYQYKPTGGLVEVISQHGEGIMMCVDAQDEVIYADQRSLPKSITCIYTIRCSNSNKERMVML